ncbi:MAG: tetratricopeptide repeat protein [Acidobacteriota bacterium]|nr:tetratricopeptide repeat protein [Acidobacteriota bacterium]
MKQATELSVCPEPSDLAALMEGSLEGEERTRVIAHVVSCEDCNEIVADTLHVLAEHPPEEHGPPSTPGSGEVRTFPGGRWSFLGGGLLAAAAVLIIGFSVNWDSVDTKDVFNRATIHLAEQGANLPRFYLTEDLGSAWAVYKPKRSVPTGIVTEDLHGYMDQLQKAGSRIRYRRAMLYILNNEPLLAYGELEDDKGGTPEQICLQATAVYLVALNKNHQEMLDDAVNLLREASRLYPGNPMIHYNLARILEETNRSEEAKELWRRFLELESQGPYAENARESLEQTAS